MWKHYLSINENPGPLVQIFLIWGEGGGRGWGRGEEGGGEVQIDLNKEQLLKATKSQAAANRSPNFWLTEMGTDR